MKLPSFLLPALLDPSGHSATSLVDSKGEGDSQIATKGVPMRLSLNADDVALMAKECIVRFDLNYDQTSVLKHVARWFVRDSSGGGDEVEDWVSSDEIDRILNSQPDSNSMNVTGDASKHIDPATYDITPGGA